MASHKEIIQPPSTQATTGDIDVDKANVDKLHKNAIGLPGVLYFCLAGSAPISAMLFNVPSMTAQAGAAAPLAFLLSGIGLMLLGVAICGWILYMGAAQPGQAHRLSSGLAHAWRLRAF